MKLTAQRLKELLHYDPKTGIWTRLKSATRKDWVGWGAGTLLKTGYISIYVDGAAYLSHRLAFLYMTGEWPAAHVDHKNGVRSANWWSNLRQASRSQNNRNSKAKSARLKGVEIAKGHHRNKPYRARICVDKKKVFLGYYATERQAHEAYWVAAKKYHKEYARKS